MKKTLICENCEKPFQTDIYPSLPVPKHCSRVCYESMRASKPTVKQVFVCQNPACGKEFEEYAYDKPRLFCSKPCHYAARRGVNNPKWTRKLINCDNCTAEFWQVNSLIQPGKGNYCSMRCAGLHIAKKFAPLKKNGKMVPCLNCGKETYKTPHLITATVGNFCSSACIGEYRARVRVTIVCAYCGQSHRVKASHFNQGAKYCSRDCANKGTEPTTLEIIGGQLLIAMGFDYVCQYRIGKFIVDAYIPSLNLVVQFDGDYWHNQPSAKRRDERHAAYMQSRGIPFVRVKQSELMKNYEVLRERIIHVCELPPSQVPLLPTPFVPRLNWRGE